MKQLHFDYYMQIDYTEIVSKCHFTIKCFPQNTLRQAVDSVSTSILPDVPYSRGEDSFGNMQIYGEDMVPHKSFHFHIEGDVRTGFCAYESDAVSNMIPVFRHPHGLNMPGELLKKYHDSLGENGEANAYQRGIYLMHSLHRDFAYEKGCTSMRTTAEEAWRLGRGVCQDYSHILISLLHMDKIPARYVTGLLVGEGASHAWVEVLHDGKWYGIDPTNDTLAGDDHIRIGCGRDASDCLINRGIMHGGGNQTQSVKACVSKTDDFKD